MKLVANLKVAVMVEIVDIEPRPEVVTQEEQILRDVAYKTLAYPIALNAGVRVSVTSREEATGIVKSLLSTLVANIPAGRALGDLSVTERDFTPAEEKPGAAV